MLMQQSIMLKQRQMNVEATPIMLKQRQMNVDATTYHVETLADEC